MCRYVVCSRELANDATAIPCESVTDAVSLVSTLKKLHHNVYFTEVTPVVIFLPSGGKVRAYRPLPVGTPAPAKAKLVTTPLGTRKAVRP